MLPRHELARVANTLALEQIPGDVYLSLALLPERLSARVAEIRRFVPTFDFAYWSRGTLAEVLYFLSGVGLIDLSGGTDAELARIDAWSKIRIRRTAEGADYIARCRAALDNIFQDIEGAQLPEAASA
jgi:hypothetical protein